MRSTDPPLHSRPLFKSGKCTGESCVQHGSISIVIIAQARLYLNAEQINLRIILILLRLFKRQWSIRGQDGLQKGDARLKNMVIVLWK